MKYFKYILFTFTLIVNIHYSKGQWPTTDPAYAVTFGDEFSDTTGFYGNKIDTSKWITYPPWNIGTTTTVRLGQTLHYAGYNLYDLKDTSNVHIIPGSPGICRLIARKGSFNSYIWDFSQNPWQIPATFKYSNGSLTSKRKLKYGYFEIKFRLPSLPAPDTAHNFLPTSWLFDGNAYPNSPPPAGHSEIDMFEIDMSASSPTSHYDFTSSMYYSWTPHQNDSIEIRDHRNQLANVSANIWHTAGVYWDKDSVSYYYDGNFHYSLKGTLTNGNYSWHADSLFPMRVFIEAYIPNGFTAQQNPARRIDTAAMVFPFVYEIDYYKVWQLKKDCINDKVYLNTTTSSFDSKLYKSLTLGGSGGNADFTGAGKASALGVDYVLLTEGTSIGTSTEFYARTLACPGDVLQYQNAIVNPAPDFYNNNRTKKR